MPLRRNLLKRSLFGLMAGMYVLALPVPIAVYAEDGTAAPTAEEVVPAQTPETTAPTAANTGPQQPPGPDTSYRYNEETGLYENDFYTWDPVTKQTAPKNPTYYSYNPETEHWDTEEYVYAPESGTYVPQTTSVVSPPPQQQTATTQATTPQPKQIARPASLNLSAPIGVNTTQPGPQSLSVIDYDNSSSGSFDLFFDASISTTHSSNATSGDASVIQNTTGGNATSGDALAMANIMNMIQSVWGWNGLMPEIYTADIQGDYVGDIMIDPAHLAAQNSGCTDCDVTVNATINGSIENNVDLLAQSGDATVSQNTSGGNATSGDAAAIANIINMINSSVTAGESFLGVLNIHGNFEGDVLVPDDLYGELLAANVPSTQITLGSDTDIDIDLDDSHSITNSINTTATSGQAQVTNNTSGGNATSGDAETSVTVFNLTGRQVIGSNAFLVFVNVSGEWVGFITDAPEGTTAAAFGTGITSNTCMACGGDIEADIDTNSSITNNLNVTAATGDAEVSYNTSGGDATTGDAKASANVANITNSSFAMSNLFTLLFVNVFGDWLGAVGTNTAFGNKIETPISQAMPQKPAGNTLAASSSQTAQNTPPTKPKQPSVRIYRASFAEDKNGNSVLASAVETTPPRPSGSQQESSPLADSVSALSGSADFTAFWLFSIIAAAYVLIFHGSSLVSFLKR